MSEIEWQLLRQRKSRRQSHETELEPESLRASELYEIFLNI